MAIDTSSDEFKEAAQPLIDAATEAAKAESDKEIKKLVGERNKLKEQVRAYGDLDAETARELASKREEIEAGAKDVDKRVTQLKADHDKIVQQLKSENASLKEGLDGALIDTAAHAAVAEFKGNAKLLMPLIRDRARVQEVEGKRMAVVLDEEGNPALAPGATKANERMTIKHLVESMSKDESLAGAFAGTGSSGGGAAPGTAGGGTRKPVQLTDLTSLGRLSSEELASVSSGKATT